MPNLRKSYIYAAFYLASLICAAPAAAEDWRLVDDGDDMAYFIDRDTLRRIEREVRVWVWTIAKYRDRDGDNWKSFMKVDCEELSYITLQETKFLKERSKASTGPSDREYAIPGSVMENVLLAACKPRKLGRRWENPYAERKAEWQKSDAESEGQEKATIDP